MGNRIKIRRKELRIKQAELAEKLNISNNHMSSIENGRQKPSLDIFIGFVIYSMLHQTTFCSAACMLIIFHRILLINYGYVINPT